MKKYKVDITDSAGNVEETLDEVFELYEDAEYEAQLCVSNYKAGAEVLKMAGEEYCDPEDIDYVIYEIP